MNYNIIFKVRDIGKELNSVTSFNEELTDPTVGQIKSLCKTTTYTDIISERFISPGMGVNPPDDEIVVSNNVLYSILVN
jgi:hypothetical protein